MIKFFGIGETRKKIFCKMMHVDEQGTSQIKPKKKNKWEEEIKYCQACYLMGKQTPLKLYQINMEEAVILCPEYKECCYPEIYGFQFVNRSYDELGSDVSSSDDESDNDNEDHPKPVIYDEVENLIEKLQSEVSEINTDNFIVNSILNSPGNNKKETSMSLLVNEIDRRLVHLDEKVVENINENNRVLMETENKSNYIDNDLLNDLDDILSGCNETAVSPPPDGTDVSNELNFSEIMLSPNSTKKEIQLIEAQSAASTPETLLPITNDAPKQRIKVVSEKLLTPNNIELPIETQNVSAQCFTVERTQLNQISLKTIKSSPDEAGDSLSQKNIIKTVLNQKTDTNKSETMLANQKNVRRSLRKTKNESPTKNYDLRTKSTSNFKSDQ